MNFRTKSFRHIAQRVSSTVAVPALLAACFCSFASASVWTGGGADNEFSTVANWDDMLINGTQDISGAFTVERIVNNTNSRTFVNGGAVLNITGGVHDDNQTGASTRNFLGRTSPGTINLSAGSYSIGHMLSIGGGNVSTGDGTFSQTGGDLMIYRGANTANDMGNKGRASLEVGDLTAGEGDGLFEISGGSMSTRFGADIGGAGIFSVIGSASTVEVGRINAGSDGWFDMYPGSTLSAELDAGGLTEIVVANETGTLNGGSAMFQMGSILDVSFGAGVTHTPGTWTVLRLENGDITDMGLTLSASSNWSFGVDNSGMDGLLTATYIPEPGSFVLLAMGGLFLIRRRK